jgi:alpha-2-macroglobulin
MDVNRQSWTGTTNLLVHPANIYVGLRSERVFVERGAPLKIDVIVTDLDGEPVLDRPVELRAARLEWVHRGEWVEEEVDPQICRVGSAPEPVTCTFETPIGGKYTSRRRSRTIRGV